MYFFLILKKNWFRDISLLKINIKQITKEDDSVYGIYGDHNIRNQIEILPEDYNYILGKDVSDWIANNYNWLIERFGY